MTYASIMVHVDNGPDTGERVLLAVDLADRFNARLTGLAAREAPLPSWTTSAGHDAVVAEAITGVRCKLDAMEAAFRNKVGKRGALEWRASVQQTNQFLIEQSCAADLVILGRRGYADLGVDAFSASPGDVVMEAGRPILLTPPGAKRLAATRVVVGWRNTREARRAVKDALPFLKAAQQVYVVTSGEEAERAGGGDVARHLKLHAVHAKVVALPRDDSANADPLLEAASSHNADLIVAGAFGHSRVREWAFGGFTQDLLQRAPVCCLMSH